MRYIIVNQKVLGLVSYVEEENPDKENLLNYDEFIEFLSAFPLQDKPEFTKELNSFKIIEINLSTGQWEVLNYERSFKEFTVEELIKLNPTGKEEKKDAIQSARNFVDNKVRRIRGRNKK